MENEQPNIEGPDRQACANPTKNDVRLTGRMLEVMEKDIVPLTQAGVRKGNKVFGAAILDKFDLSLVIAGTNHETKNPLWHGETYTIKLYWEMPREQRPDPKDCIFFATHEPCTLCLSEITWGGYDNFYYLFSHEDSRDSFNIGHDLRILKEVFKHEPGGYARENHYWKSYSLRSLIKTFDENTRKGFYAQIDKLKNIYAEMSQVYQRNKEDTLIPLK